MVFQKQIHLLPKARGFHLVTQEITEQLPELSDVKNGLMHCLLQHTSASLTLNENADSDVRGDMERYFLRSVPENAAYFRHTLEGADDMPAHIKSSILGASVSVPVSDGRLNLGSWQGIWLGEHRERASSRSIAISLIY